MNDRELLELAAKAAGLIKHKYCDAWKAMATYTLQDGYYGPTWNPLKDDGDALRLANDLGLTIGQGWNSAYVDLCSGELLGLMPAGGCQHEVHWEEFGGDKHAACRKAIVLCAAQIGEYMP